MTKPRVISLFSGAGGLDYGLHAAGFETVAAVELNEDCCDTLARNLKHADPMRCSVSDVTGEELLARAGARPGEVELLAGGPPCQPFSKAGWWKSGDSKRLTDPRATTLFDYLRLVEEVLPRAFLLENVRGMNFSGKSEGIQLLEQRIEGINQRTDSNYRLAVKVLNAADFGVPQVRERLFVVASRDGTQLAFPAATFAARSDETETGSVLPAHRTAWDALSDLAPPGDDEDLRLSGKWADLLPSVPEGHNYLWHTPEMVKEGKGGHALFGWRRRFWSFLLKLAKNRPSWTIQATPGPATGPFHWENRHLSGQELCRLQTFPDSVEIVGSIRAVRKQLGNAVPSLLAEVLGRAIRDQLLGGGAPKGRLKLLPSDKSPAPAPETPKPVGAKYLKLVKQYRKHPGHGKGPGAKRHQRMLEESG